MRETSDGSRYLLMGSSSPSLPSSASLQITPAAKLLAMLAVRNGSVGLIGVSVAPSNAPAAPSHTRLSLSECTRTIIPPGRLPSRAACVIMSFNLRALSGETEVGGLCVLAAQARPEAN